MISRRDAIGKGLRTYFTGEPCRHGHVAFRYVVNRRCMLCMKDVTKKIPAKTRYGYYKKWAEKNPGKRLESKLRSISSPKGRAGQRRRALLSSHRRRARLKGGGKITSAEALTLLERHAYRCFACGKDVKTGWTIDHVIPIAKGGANTAANAQILCKRCNSSKGAHDPIEWAIAKKKLIRPTEEVKKLLTERYGYDPRS